MSDDAPCDPLTAAVSLSDGPRVGQEGSEAQTGAQPPCLRSAVLTVEEAEWLAAALFEHFDTEGVWRADRERVESDLAGLREHQEDYGICLGCERACTCIDRRPESTSIGDCDCATNKDWPCPDARRYSDGLRRTAALYGVTS